MRKRLATFGVVKRKVFYPIPSVSDIGHVASPERPHAQAISDQVFSVLTGEHAFISQSPNRGSRIKCDGRRFSRESIYEETINQTKFSENCNND